MRKRIGAVALTACLLSFGGTAGLQAQQHGKAKGHAKHEEHREQQLNKKEQKELQHLQSERERAVAAQLREAERARAAQVRARQQYLANLQRERELQARSLASRPYVVSTPTYRYVVSGAPRTTTRVGAELLQRAVRSGYQQGFLAGRQDLSVRSGFGYRDETAFQVGTYGFTSGYVPSTDYRYYYREGFERGYQDGFYQRSQFGTVAPTGKAAILGAVLQTILGFAVR